MSPKAPVEQRFHSVESPHSSLHEELTTRTHTFDVGVSSDQRQGVFWCAQNTNEISLFPRCEVKQEVMTAPYAAFPEFRAVRVRYR